MEETRILVLHLLSALPGEASFQDMPWHEARPILGSLFWTFPANIIQQGKQQNGPSLVRPLPQPEPLTRLDPGNYFFLQWRNGSYASIEDGLEDFLRQLWWEGKACSGPLILRVLNEEGHRTFQALRALA